MIAVLVSLAGAWTIEESAEFLRRRLVVHVWLATVHMRRLGRFGWSTKYCRYWGYSRLMYLGKEDADGRWDNRRMRVWDLDL